MPDITVLLQTAIEQYGDKLLSAIVYLIVVVSVVWALKALVSAVMPLFRLLSEIVASLRASADTLKTTAETFAEVTDRQARVARDLEYLYTRSRTDEH